MDELLRVVTDAVDRDVSDALQLLWAAPNARDIAAKFLDGDVAVVIDRDGLRAFELGPNEGLLHEEGHGNRDEKTDR